MSRRRAAGLAALALLLGLAACRGLAPAALPDGPEAGSGFVDKPGWTATRQMVAAAGAVSRPS